MPGVMSQPNAILVCTPPEIHTVWAAVSRAVRTPSQAEDDIDLVAAVIPGPPDQHVKFFGNDDLDAERLTAYELGYRVQPTTQVSFDLAGFYNDYDEMITFEPGTPFMSGGTVIIPMTAENATEGHSY